MRASHNETKERTGAVEIKITLPDSGPMREVLATLVEYCRYERDHCAEEGRGTKPEWAGSFGCIVTTIEALPAQRQAAHYPNGMGEESRRLHREYNGLVQAQANGAKNGAEVRRLTDECSAKGIILVPNGENL